MIAEKYKKSLTRYEDKKGAFLYVVVLVVPFFLFVVGCLNMWLAFRIGSAAGFTIDDYVRIWMEEIDVNREYTYSGIFLAGLYKFNTALLQFSFAIVLSPFVWGVIFLRKRDRAILAVLRKYGAI